MNSNYLLKQRSLKNLVAYITWISVDDIQSAPSIFDVKDEILKFFWENTILIWHNIEFDIAMIMI